MQTTQINEDQYGRNKAHQASGLLQNGESQFFEDNEKKLRKWLYQA